MRFEALPFIVSIGVGGISAVIVKGVLDALNPYFNLPDIWYIVLISLAGISNFIFIYTYIVYHREKYD